MRWESAVRGRRVGWMGVAAAVTLVLVSGRSQALGKLQVVATTADFGSIAKEIGGGRVAVTILAEAGEDPHFVSPKPSFMVKLNRADLLIEGGAELEAGWLGPLLQGARNGKILAGAPGRVLAAEGLSLLEVPGVLDRAQGDIHAAGNPHFMLDPVNARAVAEVVEERLSRLDPAGAEEYRSNLKDFRGRLDAKLAEWEKLLGPYRGEQVVAYHNSWPYFARRFGLKIEMFLEPKPGIPPTPTHLAEVMARMKETKARVVLVEVYLSRRTADTVARATGAKVIEGCHFPGGIKGAGPGYVDLMDYLVRSLAAALGGG